MLQELIDIIKIHYKNGENLAETVRKTRTFLGRREAPCRTAKKKLVEKFELFGQVSYVKNKTRVRRSRTAENISDVAESVENTQVCSFPVVLWNKAFDKLSLHRILFEDLGLKAYKKLKPADHQQRF